MKPRIIFIHGNGTTHWSAPWAVWLKKELENQGFPTFFETFPDSILARAQYWLPFLHDHIKAGKNDVIVGWSSGAVAAMRYAERHQIRGSVLVAPSYTDLNDPMEKQSGYYETSWNWEKIKDHQQHIALIHSDNDPFIPQDEFSVISRHLQPTEIVVPKAEHFIDRTTFPELLGYLTKTY